MRAPKGAAGVLLALLVGVASAAPVAAETGAPAANASTAAATPAVAANMLVAETGSGAHTFTIEIADDPIERARGLMFRQQMAHDAGMLFIFADESERAFWMKNTILPLDIVYADASGTVVSIAKATTPFSTESIPSDGPAQFVLELNAGVADQIGLKPGDRLVHRRIVAP
ncbi:DUF192 domain-containing protein [Acuticoccus sp. I52.16.1]|uniref:DUF192 domain-containing protein n=1 Tax=Acuticoccus sp. I52.16.1 TaxID=2928472 RepID=UPI001FD3C1E8|nr:DUF192 domain-containing protein [Acuticoccus sp. I52.16.1]UOM34855.1 DUF192 domain-containing protein [Acuticoccus sp. I52.16.1]